MGVYEGKSFHNGGGSGLGIIRFRFVATGKGQSMRIFSAIRIIENQTKLKCMSCEGEIVSFLLENGPSGPREIIANCKHSPASVFSKLKDLKEMGIIKKENDEIRRQSPYNLEKIFLDSLYEQIGDWDLIVDGISEIMEAEMPDSNEFELMIISGDPKIEH